jgi:ABC-type glycerol-3-phosphate transport system substrate-binding protein
MIFDASDFIGRLENPEQSSIVGKIGYTLAPAGPAAPNYERYPSHLFTAGMAISGYSKNVEEAWQVLEWMTSTDVQRRTALESGNTGVTSVKVLSSQEFMEAYPGIDVMLEAQKLANPEFMPRISVYSELCDIIGTHISAVISGDEEPQEAMDKAAQEMLTPLKDYIK